MYGHQFYRFPVERRVHFINTQLQGGFDSLEELADDMFLDVNDIKSELNQHGYIFVPDINQFVHCVGNDLTIHFDFMVRMNSSNTLSVKRNWTL